jgi:hypothetical protein
VAFGRQLIADPFDGRDEKWASGGGNVAMVNWHRRIARQNSYGGAAMYWHVMSLAVLIGFVAAGQTGAQTGAPLHPCSNKAWGQVLQSRIQPNWTLNGSAVLFFGFPCRAR